ncbi:hypothetical protein OG21DRAFT_1527859 [Imleria badia]|nr:hypothetical protein OG21DRAFT_1527859 [Imleria badia]
MVAASQLRAPATETQLAEPAPHCTQPFHATWCPGLPDKPVPRRTSAQKQADDKQAKEVKNDKAEALKAIYQGPMHPKPHIIKKDPQGQMPVILGACHPHQAKDKAGVLGLCEVLTKATCQRLLEANASNTSDNVSARKDNLQTSMPCAGTANMDTVSENHLENHLVAQARIQSHMPLAHARAAMGATITNKDGESYEHPGPAKIQSYVAPPSNAITDADSDSASEAPANNWGFHSKGTERGRVWPQAMTPGSHPRGLGTARKQSRLICVEEVIDLTELMTGTHLVMERSPKQAASFKKVKTEEMGAADKVTKDVTSAKDTTHAVNSKDAVKWKYTKANLPQLMQEDPKDKRSKMVIPCLIL